MRKPVVLITGAGGEIGHGLIDRLAERGDRRIVTLDSRASTSRSRRRWIARSPGRSSTRAARAHAGGVRGRPGLPPRGAALDALRVHAGHGAPGQRRRHAEPARVRAARSGIARPARRLHLSRRRSRPTACRDLDDQDARRARSRKTSTCIRRRCTGATSCIASMLGDYYARHYKQLAAEHGERQGRFPLRAVPGPDFGADGAVGRHVGLRAGDDPRRRERGAVRLLRPPRHADPVHGDARRRRGAADAGGGAARRGCSGPPTTSAPSIRPPRKSATSCCRPSPARRSPGRSTRSGRGSSIRGRRTSTTPPRAATGASRPATTSTRALQRVPDSDDHAGAIRTFRNQDQHMPKLTVEGCCTSRCRSRQAARARARAGRGSSRCMRAAAMRAARPAASSSSTGEPDTMTAAEKHVLNARGLTGVRLSCQIICDHDMTVRAHQPPRGQRDDLMSGPTPQPTIQPPPEWIQMPRTVSSASASTPSTPPDRVQFRGALERGLDVRADVLVAHVVVELRLLDHRGAAGRARRRGQRAARGAEPIRQVLERAQSRRVDRRHVAQPEDDDRRQARRVLP